MNRQPAKNQGWDIALLVASLLTLLISLSATLVMAFSALAAWSGGKEQMALANEWGAASAMALGAASLPALFWSGRAILGHSPPGQRRPSTRWLWLAILFPMSIAVGSAAYSGSILPGLLGPPAHLTAAVLPVLVGLLLVRRYAPPAPPRRSWGQFLAGLWAVPAMALVLEGLALLPVIFILIFGIGLTLPPDLLRSLATQGSTMPDSQLRQVIDSLLSQPWILALILGYVSLLVPVIEETLKTAALWPLLRNRPSPAVAFVSGTLGGAGYALFEALFLTQPGAEWAGVMIGRAGASFMHICTASFAAWGLAEGVVRGKWKVTLGIFIVAVSMHGLWNASAIGIGLSGLPSSAGQQILSPGIEQALSAVGLGALATLGLGSLVLPSLAIRRLRSKNNMHDGT
jgi:uncharacterized protein YjeT (DUF2065 family)